MQNKTRHAIVSFDCGESSGCIKYKSKVQKVILRIKQRKNREPFNFDVHDQRIANVLKDAFLKRRAYVHPKMRKCDVEEIREIVLSYYKWFEMTWKSWDLQNVTPWRFLKVFLVFPTPRDFLHFFLSGLELNSEMSCGRLSGGTPYCVGCHSILKGTSHAGGEFRVHLSFFISNSNDARLVSTDLQRLE